MKLRNKKTGEIVKRMDLVIREEGVVFNTDEQYHSLAELNEEWEDYEEPKTHWYIYGSEPFEVDEENWDKDYIEELKSIGNYFETGKEAEKAVKKLKAWKRLKDKGFRFELRPGIARGVIRYYVKEESNEVEQDLQICFGGEDE